MEYRLKKSLGQHFLKDESAKKSIAESSEASKERQSF
jgi:16S rRNA A1518/A1519 N6-dimethyltransferase RsmA/KsgA/DIM1 with predicted DNA glycosylase/AP lyase activity